jgi:2'-5' RNA ligase
MFPPRAPFLDIEGAFASRAPVIGGAVRDERLRLFLALRLPDVVRDRLAAWADDHARGAGRLVPREDLHVTLAFLGSRPAGELDAVVAALREAALAAGSIELAPAGWRETRSVGMVRLDDAGGAAGRLAVDLHQRLEGLGVYRREARPWLAHVTVVRFRERPRLRPPLPELGAFAPSDAAAYLSRLHPSGARYEVLASTLLGGRG